ncbi:hypothetical protein JXJ21_09090 [candidate division KSB1 bacterium]|nr:hypothetical protein [candidate division KSB1 bacterium]
MGVNPVCYARILFQVLNPLDHHRAFFRIGFFLAMAATSYMICIECSLPVLSFNFGSGWLLSNSVARV